MANGQKLCQVSNGNQDSNSTYDRWESKDEFDEFFTDVRGTFEVRTA